VLDAHLNVCWLRPEQVVWDAAASFLVRTQGLERPTLDLGSGNGINSFVTAGGRFGAAFDWYVNVDVEAPSSNTDIHDAPATVCAPFITRRPQYRIDVAVDVKQQLLQQAGGLGFYGQTVQCDANASLPFQDRTFSTVFSNILYWLEEPRHALRECGRILRDGGRAILCLPDPLFLEFCESYRWRPLKSEWLRLLNAGRDACVRWVFTPDDVERIARDAGFEVVSCRSYLQRRTLAVWDVGLRMVARPLIRLVNSVTPARRAEVKQDWIRTIRPLLQALLNEELTHDGPGGFHFVVLQKRS
jgi:SAM-dependent methyltransferase